MKLRYISKLNLFKRKIRRFITRINGKYLLSLVLAFGLRGFRCVIRIEEDEIPIADPDEDKVHGGAKEFSRKNIKEIIRIFLWQENLDMALLMVKQITLLLPKALLIAATLNSSSSSQLLPSGSTW